jgi:hypothetical protein
MHRKDLYRPFGLHNEVAVAVEGDNYKGGR